MTATTSTGESYRARVQRTRIATAPRDCARTPDWTVEAALDSLSLRTKLPQRIVEPCAGDGPFVRALIARGHTVIAVEVREETRRSLEILRPYRLWIGSWFDYTKALTDAKVDCGELGVIGNPPYMLAQAFVESARACGFGYVAFLLRLGFLASRGRRKFWEHHAPTGLHVFGRRPSFTGNGATDATEYCMLEWEKGKPPLSIHWIYGLPE